VARKTRSRAPVIASRQLQRRSKEGLAEPFTIRVRAPYRSKGDYICEFEILGLKHPIQDRTVGGDSMQALLGAIYSIQKTVKANALQLSWFDGPVGDVGFPWAMIFVRYEDRELRDRIDLLVRDLGGSSDAQSQVAFGNSED
jgi:hypothetical protein